MVDFNAMLLQQFKVLRPDFAILYAKLPNAWAECPIALTLEAQRAFLLKARKLRIKTSDVQVKQGELDKLLPVDPRSLAPQQIRIAGSEGKIQGV